MKSAIYGLLAHGGFMAATGLSAMLAGPLALADPMGAGFLAGAGSALFALGVRELLEFYSSTAQLSAALCAEGLGSAYTAFLLVHNRGPAAVSGARAVLSIDAAPGELKRLAVPCGSGRATAGAVAAGVRGELLPWAGGSYEASIAPHQYAKVHLFNVAKDGGDYLVEIPGASERVECFRIGRNTRLAARVYVSGSGARRTLEVGLQISWDFLDSLSMGAQACVAKGK